MRYDDCEWATLSDNGFEVVDNIIDMNTCIKLRTEMWNWLNAKTKNCDRPIVENDFTTYKTIFELRPLHGMLLQHWDTGHNPMSWTIRQHPAVIERFADIWGTEDLVTSFDGLSISLPPEYTNRGWHHSGKSSCSEWFHCDQSFTRNEFECVQGLVNLYDINSGDATLRVLNKSHLLHGEVARKLNLIAKQDWYKLQPHEKDYYLQRLGHSADICVKAKAGSLILWDSRLIHQGTEPKPDRQQINYRCALYVCMLPKKNCNSNMLRKRIRCFEDRRTTNHNPVKVKMFSRLPNTWFGGRGAGTPPLPLVEMDKNLQITQKMKNLVGYSNVCSKKLVEK